MAIDTQEKVYQIALSHVKGVGYVLLKQLVAQFGSAQAVFQATLKELTKIPGSSKRLAQEILKKNTVPQATECLSVHKKANVRIITPWEDAYPARLLHIHDAPPLLYLQGNVDLNAAKIISVVGTRRATTYGKKVVEMLLNELSAAPVLIVSGLAYGIDIHAHRTALEHGMPTLAVVAGGLDIIYPSPHKKVAEEILAQGGLVSEHPLQTKPEAHQFAARNRIIAGIADATIVVEAGQKSGALITAHYANAYNREVFAVCGGIYDPYSVGCHHLIKTHQAHLLTNTADIAYIMNWHTGMPTVQPSQSILEQFPELTKAERLAIQAFEKLQKEVHIDELSYQSQIPLNQLAAVLLQLELKNMIRFLPGKKFKLDVYPR